MIFCKYRKIGLTLKYGGLVLLFRNLCINKVCMYEASSRKRKNYNSLNKLYSLNDKVMNIVMKFVEVLYEELIILEILNILFSTIYVFCADFECRIRKQKP